VAMSQLQKLGNDQTHRPRRGRTYLTGSVSKAQAASGRIAVASARVLPTFLAGTIATGELAMSATRCCV